MLTTPTPTGAALADPDGTAHAAAADEPGRSGGAGTAARTTPEAKAPHPTGLCRASSNIATDGHPGKAADSPAFADLSCTDDGRRVDGPTPTPRPPARRAAPPLLPATPSSGPASPTTPAARRTTPTARTRPRSPARPAMARGRRACRHQGPRSVGRAPAGRLTQPLQARRAVRRRYSQSRTVSPVPWSYRAASAARSWSSAATRSGSSAMLRYAAIVGP